MTIGKTGDSFGCVVANLLEQCVKDGKDSCTITMEYDVPNEVIKAIIVILNECANIETKIMSAESER